MADPILGDSLLSTLSNTAKVLADNILYARNTLNHACPDGSSQGLSVMAQESLLRSKQSIDELEQIQRSIDAIIIREQARGDRSYVPAMTVDCPDYRENHMHVLGNEVGAMLSVIDRIDSPGAGIDLPDQVITPGWTEFNEKYSEKVEYRPDNEEAPGIGGPRSIQYYYKCIYNACPSKPLKYKSKLRDHHSVHTSQKHYCNLCHTQGLLTPGFKQTRSLKRHIRKHHAGGLPQPLQQPGPLDFLPTQGTSEFDMIFSLMSDNNDGLESGSPCVDPRLTQSEPWAPDEYN